MGNHPFNVIVVLFWLATMTWLVVAKVLPPMRVGEPPSYQSILQQSSDARPVCWSIRLDGEPIGWAASRLVRRDDGISEFHSRVYLERLPLDELAPSWLARVLRPLLSELRQLDIDKRSRMTVDPLGRLVGFDSVVRIGDLPDVIKVEGQVEGSALMLSIHSGGVPHRAEMYLPPNALVTDELSPQAVMPGLRVGQSWTVPLYSPFRAPTSPIEVLHARVERSELLSWNGGQVPGKLVVFRSDPGSGPAVDEIRGRMWVRDDGMVLRQEVSVLRSKFQFLRMPEDDAEMVRAAMEGWRASPGAEVAPTARAGGASP